MRRADRDAMIRAAIKAGIGGGEIVAVLTPGERKRLERMRARAGLGVLTIEFRIEDFVEAALSRGLLTPVNQNDRAVVARVAGRMLDRWSSDVLSRVTQGTGRRV